MRSDVLRAAGFGLLLLAAAGAGYAQEGPAAASGDPRVGLKAGVKDAGVAAKGMELVTNVPKPDGFFDPRAPAGVPTPPEKKDSEGDKEKDSKKPEKPKSDEEQQREVQEQERRAAGLNFANSDLAFSGNHLFIGNFHGFNVYDISNPGAPQLVTSVVCPGGQGDVSVHGNILVMSVEQTRGRIDCGTQGVKAPVSPERFRGVRIFDISDVRMPKQVAAVQTCRGSHTHTLLGDPKDPANLYVYGSGTSSARSAKELAGCSGEDPEKDPDTALFSIDVIQVPVAAPGKARIVSRPRIFADPETGKIAGLWKGGDHGPGTQKTAVTNQCHDITVFPEVGLAAGACSGNGILLDISDPVNPKRIDEVSDANFAYWHSATFNNDGTKVIFTDEWGGGTRPRCRATDKPNWGANAIFDIVDRKLQFRSYYKLPAPQTEQENCVAHNGSLVPVPGRDIMVQAWYQGGVSVFDFTDSSRPFEIAFFDRGPLDAKHLITGGHWSAYWYNGYVYGAEMARGLDVFRLVATEQLTRHELEAATLAKAERMNVQQQTRASWPSNAVIARAMLDQLKRSQALAADRAEAAERALAQVGAGEGGPAADLAAQLEESARSAATRDAERLRTIAAVLRGRAL